MLAEKLKANDVVAIKLGSGEEIIARFVSDEGNHYEVKSPLQMILQAMENSSQGFLSFAPWMLGLADDASVKISKSNVVAATKARQEAANQYTRVTSKLEVPTGDQVTNLTANN